MITGKLTVRVDAVGNRSWSKIFKLQKEIEQIAYRLLTPRLDRIQTVKEQLARFIGAGVANPPVHFLQQQDLRKPRSDTLADVQKRWLGRQRSDLRVPASWG
ncbi:hypothetical protein [Kocuria rosea]|uniref:hypothetical protein n=1 Tax=Kocuria rosea TaxID=1275 RepID=UPI0012FB249E|nr:hypothetical protein [Kocuria polaris]